MEYGIWNMEYIWNISKIWNMEYENIKIWNMGFHMERSICVIHIKKRKKRKKEEKERKKERKRIIFNRILLSDYLMLISFK